MSCDIPYVQNLEGNDTNELIYKTETDPQTQRTNERGRVGGLGIDWEFGIDR